MISSKLHKFQEYMFNFIFLIIYFLYFIIALGLSATAPKYLSFLDYYIKIYVSLFLLLRFNPFRKLKFTRLDKQIAFSAGFFILSATTSINTKIINYIKNIF
jgi:hypothetical protein